MAYNSVTHGGDGLSLWAGQTTMDTGKGGSNDNLFHENDFSHAPTNGTEATFSRNRLSSARGARVTPTAGKMGGEITVTPRLGAVVDYDVTLEYRGASVTSPRGAITKAHVPYTFRYSRFFAPVDWTVRFFEYGHASDPLKQPQAFEQLLLGTPLKTVKVDRLDYISGRAIEDGVPRDRFALTAEGTVNLPAGAHTLQVISDDGARVWADGKLILDAWAPHESRVDRVPLAGGRHTLKVHYFEAGGWAEMRLDIQPRRMGH